MTRSPSQLRRDALQIWQAGVDAVRSAALVRQALRVDANTLFVVPRSIPKTYLAPIAQTPNDHNNKPS